MKRWTRLVPVVLVVAAAVLFSGCMKPAEIDLSKLPGQVQRLAFSPDGRTLASGGDGQTIQLWDVATGKATATLYSGKTCCLAFSPDGKMLASGSDKGRVYLWDVAAAKAVAILEAHDQSVEAVAFSPDGKTLASGSWDETTRLWEVAIERNIGTLSTGPATGLAFSPDGKTLAVGVAGNTIQLWNLADRTSRVLLENNNEYATPRVVFSPDGKTLASGGVCISDILVWDVAGSRKIATIAGENPDGFELVAFAPDGKTLVAVGLFGTITLSNAATGARIAGRGESVWVHCWAAALSPDGKTLAVCLSSETQPPSNVIQFLSVEKLRKAGP
jgi:WD40 repeat protein